MHCVVQLSPEGLKKDVFLGKVMDLSMAKHQWIENRLHSISELMKKADKMPEVSYCTFCMVCIISPKDVLSNRKRHSA